ncbi:MAG: hypothetical protein KA716_14585 [Gloeotrichia echinulata DEX184]|nr:hypothetical protein [Gloeotrichia echinulata DEX184]
MRYGVNHHICCQIAKHKRLTHPTRDIDERAIAPLIVRSPDLVQCEVRNAITLSIFTQNAIADIVVRSPIYHFF